jgi:hypothetical protein
MAVIAVAMRISISVKPFSLFTRRMTLAPSRTDCAVTKAAPHPRTFVVLPNLDLP